MKKITTILAIAVCMAAGAQAQNAAKKEAAPAKAAQPVAQQKMTPEQEMMMKKWQEYMTPGDMHKMMAESNGDWSEDITMWMAPGAPAEKSTSTCNNTMILGGRYQQSTHKGSYNGMPYEGVSTMGYDNIKKVFESSWIDNMGTGIMNMEGKYDAATKTVTSLGKEVDPMTGKDMDVRETFMMMDKNTQLMTMYMTPVGGKEYKTMEIKFTRKM